MTTRMFPSTIRVFAISPDGRLMVTGSQYGHLYVHNCATPPYELLCETTKEWCEPVTTFAVAADERDDLLVVTGHWGWMVRLWRVETVARQLRFEWTNHEEEEDGLSSCMLHARISHHRQWVAVGGWIDDDMDYTIRLHALRNCRHRRTLVNHTGQIFDFCFSPDDRVLVTAGYDKNLSVWSVESGEQLQYVHLDAVVYRMALGGYAEIVTVHKDGRVRMWPFNGKNLDHANVRQCTTTFLSIVNGALHCTQDGRHAITGGQGRGTYDFCLFV